MRLRWMPQARSDLSEIVAYIARDEPDAAERMYSRILAAATLLLEQPGLGRAGRVEETREFLIPRTQYILPYRVRGGSRGTVEILAVIHTARQWPEGFD
ncbi:MAG: type II toxin-antitoxin system RelE/ParE family toxin [Chloroflexota bacterium]